MVEIFLRNTSVTFQQGLSEKEIMSKIGCIESMPESSSNGKKNEKRVEKAKATVQNHVDGSLKTHSE